MAARLQKTGLAGFFTFELGADLVDAAGRFRREPLVLQNGCFGSGADIRPLDLRMTASQRLRPFVRGSQLHGFRSKAAIELP